MKRKINVDLTARERFMLLSALNAKKAFYRTVEFEEEPGELNRKVDTIDTILKKIGWNRKDGFVF